MGQRRPETEHRIQDTGDRMKRSRSIKIVLWLFGRFSNRQEHYGFLGDVEEMTRFLRKESWWRAELWLWMQLIRLIQAILIDHLFWSYVMFRNYMKTAFRNIRRFKMYSFINIGGLAIGMSVFVLIFLYVKHEFSYDRFHENVERMYRVEQVRENNEIIPLTPAPLAQTLIDDVPEVTTTVRIWRTSGHLYYGERRKFYENRGLYAENTLFELFNFPLIQGNPLNALKEPYSIVLSQEIAEKYFGHEDPVGKILRFKKAHDLKVTCVMKDIPKNSHIQCDFIVSFSTLEAIYGQTELTRWDRDDTYTYILASDQNVMHHINQKIRNRLNEHRVGENISTLYLMPVSKIHLYSNTNYEISSTMPLGIVLVLGGFGLLTLCIACVNYMNLSTALSFNRSCEVGIRKVVGSNRSRLIHQFLVESVILSFVSMAFALILVRIFLPDFNLLLDRELELNLFTSGRLLFQMVSIAVIVGVLSGSYPAFFLSSVKPVAALKKILKSGAKGRFFRKLLVISQFAFSIIFIIISIVWFQLGYYLRNKGFGFETEHILVLPLNKFSDESLDKFGVFKEELLNNPDILYASVSTDLPFSIYWQTEVNWNVAGADEKGWITHARCDENFLDLYDIELVEGRKFSREFTTDVEEGCLINETAARMFGWKTENSEISPLGKRITASGIHSTIIGVVADFHSTDLRLAIKPLMMRLHGSKPDQGDFLSVRMNPVDIPSTLHFIEQKFSEIFPDEIYDFSFLETLFGRTFVTFDNWNKLFASISLIAICVALMGLFGLASLTVNQRTKEVGIRKVVGASVSHIVILLLKEFFKIVIYANLIAAPLAYLLSYGLLQQFTYRINVQVWVFLLTGVVTLIVATLAVSGQAVKAAVVNPVDSLRYE